MLPKRVVQEYAVPVNGQPQRADVVVVGDRAEPLVLADTSGRQLIVAPGRLAYIETLPERTQKVGFGIG